MPGREGRSAQTDFFEALGAEAAGLRARGVVRTYARGVALFHERQLPDGVFVLIAGRVKLTCLSETGSELMIAVRGPGDVLGELSAIDGSPRSATAIAMEPVDALVLPGHTFTSFLEQSRVAALALIRMLSHRLREGDRMRLEFAAQDSMGRVAARVTELCDHFGEPDGEAVRIDLSLSQEELASWTACSREAVSKALQGMRRMGWIETRRRGITVLEPESLRRRAFMGR
jgi:CRP/FNR family transcriptional regulator, cyclic AMP receptor protein